MFTENRDCHAVSLPARHVLESVIFCQDLKINNSVVQKLFLAKFGKILHCCTMFGAQAYFLGHGIFINLYVEVTEAVQYRNNRPTCTL